MERTFVMVKSDGVQRRLVGEILGRFERKGLKIVGLKILRMPPAQAEDLYSVHKGRPFYDGLVKFITASPVVTMVLEGTRAIQVVRTMLGKTFSYEAEPGTIRGDFGVSKGYNLIHGSDSPESAQREIPIFFQKNELVDWKSVDVEWVYEGPERE